CCAAYQPFASPACSRYCPRISGCFYLRYVLMGSAPFDPTRRSQPRGDGRDFWTRRPTLNASALGDGGSVFRLMAKPNRRTIHGMYSHVFRLFMLWLWLDLCPNQYGHYH